MAYEGRISISIQLTLLAFAEKLIKEAQDEIRTKNITGFGAHNTTGNLAQSFRPVADVNGLVVFAAKYLETVIYGRKPGKNPPFDAIRQWTIDKGITPNPKEYVRGDKAGQPYPQELLRDSLSWAIVKKMAKEGSIVWQKFNGNNSELLKSAIDSTTINDLLNNLTLDLTTEIRSNIISAYGELSLSGRNL